MSDWAWGALIYVVGLAVVLTVGVTVLRRRVSRRNKYDGLKLRAGWEEPRK